LPTQQFMHNLSAELKLVVNAAQLPFRHDQVLVEGGEGSLLGLGGGAVQATGLAHEPDVKVNPFFQRL